MATGLIGTPLRPDRPGAFDGPILHFSDYGRPAAFLRLSIGRPEGMTSAPAAMVDEERISMIDAGALPGIRSDRTVVLPGISRLEGRSVLSAHGTRRHFDAIVGALGYEVDLRPLQGARRHALCDDGQMRPCSGPLLLLLSRLALRPAQGHIAGGPGHHTATGATPSRRNGVSPRRRICAAGTECRHATACPKPLLPRSRQGR